jgi:hypothetical protein
MAQLPKARLLLLSCCAALVGCTGSIESDGPMQGPTGVGVDIDGDGIIDGYDIDGDGVITVIERVFEELSFTAPDRGGEKVVVDADMVEASLGDLARVTDVSRYVL